MSEEQNQEQNEEQAEGKAKRTVSEEIELAGNQVVGKVKELIKEGNVRRLIIRNSSGKVIYDTTLTTAGGLGGALALLGGPIIVAIAAVVAAVSKVKIEVVREVDDEGEVETGKKKVEIDVDDEA
jgi:hypothetical protein